MTEILKSDKANYYVLPIINTGDSLTYFEFDRTKRPMQVAIWYHNNSFSKGIVDHFLSDKFPIPLNKVKFIDGSLALKLIRAIFEYLDDVEKSYYIML